MLVVQEKVIIPPFNQFCQYGIHVCFAQLVGSEQTFYAGVLAWRKSKFYAGVSRRNMKIRFRRKHIANSTPAILAYIYQAKFCHKNLSIHGNIIILWNTKVGYCNAFTRKNEDVHQSILFMTGFLSVHLSASVSWSVISCQFLFWYNII